MMSYAGSKAIGVNPNTDNMVAAVELAVFLGSPEAQRAHYEMVRDDPLLYGADGGSGDRG